MASSGSDFNEKTYLRASQENIVAAHELHQHQHFVLSFYVAGLAVECLLRAYHYRRNPEFEARHDLFQLARDSGFLHGSPVGMRNELHGALSEVAIRWSNNHRYRSKESLRAYLRRAKLYGIAGNKTIRGDIIKHNASAILNAATLLVTVGVEQWNHSSKR